MPQQQRYHVHRIDDVYHLLCCRADCRAAQVVSTTTESIIIIIITVGITVGIVIVID